MARRKDKEQAIKLRLKGYSYSQIKLEMGLSKSTLSNWLTDYPLSPEKIRELRDLNPRRIENCRNTKLKKRQEKLEIIYKKAEIEIGSLSKRDLLIAGLFLYWGEGTKAARNMVALTNTDPSMLKFFIKWLKLFDVSTSMIKVKLHLYSDMNIKEKTNFWSKELKIPIKNFKNPYIKESSFSSLTYKNSFGHGTCVLYYPNGELYNKIMMSLRYLREVVSTS